MARKIKVEIVGDADKLKRAFRDASSSGSKFGSAMRSLGKVAAVGVGGAFVGLAAVLRTGFAELSEGQKVAAQTAAVLKSTGGAANVTAKQVSRLSESISAYSGVDDEAVQAGENLLLTFVKLQNRTGKGNKIFSRATKTIVDMSVALGQDMKSSAIQVGKALNDPIRGITALRRVGVSFTKAQEKQIKALVESGKTMEAQKLILRELAVEFGGSARAYGNTLPGALAKLRNAFEGVTGELATGLAPIVKSVAKDLTEKLTDPAFVARVRELGKVIGEKLRDVLIAVGQWFRDHWDEIKGAFRIAKDLADKLVTGVKGVKTALDTILDVLPGGSQTLIGAIVAGLVAKKVIAISKAVNALRLDLTKLAASKYALKIGIGVTIAGIIYGPLKKLFEQGLGANFQGATPGGLMPVKRGGKWVDPVSGAPVQDQNFWNKRAAATAGAGIGRGVGRGGGIGRAHGGPMMPGMLYRVGEKGPETVAVGAPSMAYPGGGVHIENLYLPGVQNARQLLAELQRMAKNGTSQTRGRFGGQKLAVL